jgi:hypothetical protein
MIVRRPAVFEVRSCLVVCCCGRAVPKAGREACLWRWRHCSWGSRWRLCCWVLRRCSGVSVLGVLVRAWFLGTETLRTCASRGIGTSEVDVPIRPCVVDDAGRWRKLDFVFSISTQNG